MADATKCAMTDTKTRDLVSALGLVEGATWDMALGWVRIFVADRDRLAQLKTQAYLDSLKVNAELEEAKAWAVAAMERVARFHESRARWASWVDEAVKPLQKALTKRNKRLTTMQAALRATKRQLWAVTQERDALRVELANEKREHAETAELGMKATYALEHAEQRAETFRKAMNIAAELTSATVERAERAEGALGIRETPK